MLKLLDRQLIRSYVKAYLVCLVSLLGLFIVVDLFTNLDEFVKDKTGVWAVIQYVSKYYGFKTVQIFDQLSQAIVLLAGMFTIAWMQRNNEILPLLSAGVSTRRIVRPVLMASCFMLALGVLNQEFVLPRVDGFMVEYRNDGDHDVGVKGGYDSNGIHITGRKAYKNELFVEGFICTIPAGVGRDSPTTLQAQEARYVPPEEDEPRSGGWILTGTAPPELESWPRRDILENLVPGKYFLRTGLDFDAVVRHKNWVMYVDTIHLLQELYRPGNTRLAELAVVFHMRLTKPILGLILVFMGLAVILRDQNRNVFVSAGMCLVLCALFFTACFACKYLGDHDVLSPTLAAWLPVLSFGPLSFVMFDAVHT